MLILGCGRGNSSESEPDDDTQAAATTARTAIVVALQADGSTLDPHKATDAGSKRLLENLHSSLFRYTATYGDVEPDLVRDYRWSDDSRLLTLTLVDNASFHSGRPVLAADVKYSLERMRDSGVQHRNERPPETRSYDCSPKLCEFS
jgi:peptide/nickel transport system substrate-binding protein